MAKRRGQGEGGIRQRPDGRWEATINLGWRDGKRQRKFIYGRTRAEAATKLRAAQVGTDRGIPTGDARVTVEQYLTRWLEQQQRSGKARNTVAQYEWAVNVHLVPELGKKKLAQLLPDDVDRFLERRADAGASKSTLARLRSVLSMALEQAAKRDVVARNVAALSEMPSAPTKVKKALTQDQANALLAAAAGDRLEVAYLTMLTLGCRPGEALGLAWENVDLDAGTVRIVQALKVEGGTDVVLGSLKTAGSRRNIALPAVLAEGLRAHRRRQLEERMKLGPAWVDTGLVFTTQLGTPIHPRNFRRSFDRLVERAGLTGWSPGELRHSTVSLLSAAGMRAEDIADLVGHTTTRMTTQVYRHQVTPTISTAKETTDRLFGGLGGQLGGQTAEQER